MIAFFQKIVEAALPYLKKAPDLFSTLGDICIFFITVYTFRLTIFPKKLNIVDLGESFSAFKGDSLHITLENRSLCSILVLEVSIISDLGELKGFKGHCIIENFKCATIEMEPYSAIIDKNGKPVHQCFGSKGFYIVVKTSRGTQYIPYKKKRWAIKKPNKKFSHYDNLEVLRSYYNDLIVKPDFEYALVFNDSLGNTKTIFITTNGMMSDALFGYNALTKDIMASEDALKRHFDGEFSKYGLRYALRRINDKFSFINQDVQ